MLLAFLGLIKMVNFVSIGDMGVAFNKYQHHNIVYVSDAPVVVIILSKEGRAKGCTVVG